MMEIISLLTALSAGILANSLYEVIKTRFARIKSRNIFIKLPSGSEYEIESSKADGKELEELIKSILYSTEESFSFKPTDVKIADDVILPIIDIIKQRIESSKLDIKLSPKVKSMPSILIDKDAIWRIFFNILDNAVKYSKSESEILIDGVINVKTMEIRISNYIDNSMQASDIINIFEKGFRGQNAIVKDKSGLGLGLYVANRLVTYFKGNISVSVNNDTYTITILLPNENNN